MFYLTAGESHGEKLTIIIDKVPCGISISEKDINYELERRSSVYGRSDRQEHETNTCKIISGVDEGKSTGNPICVEVKNFTDENSVFDANYPRPGHADLSGVIKYNFDNFKNVAERASARETAARIVAGVVAKNLLAELDVEVYSYVTQIGSVRLESNDNNTIDQLPSQTQIAMSKLMCPDLDLSKKMEEQIDRAKEAGDTLGGKAKIIAIGLVPGIGGYSQAYDRLDSKIAGSVMSVPSVKSVSIGSSSFQSSNVGSASLDYIVKDESSGMLVRTTNYSGGIEGGMTTSMPIAINIKVKPVPSIKKPVKTINLDTMEEVVHKNELRFDTCVVPSTAVICENEIAFTLANAYLEKFGCDNLEDIKFSLRAYKQRVKSFN